MDKYKYSIIPVSVVKIESLGKVGIRTPKTLDLTLDEVKSCLKKARVFRRFSQSHIEKVTVSNCERLHNAEFIPEDKYKDFLANKKSEDRGTVKSTNTDNKKDKEVVEKTIKNLDKITKEYVDKKTEEYNNDINKIEKNLVQEQVETQVEEDSSKTEVINDDNTVDKKPIEEKKNNKPSEKTSVNIKNNKKANK